MPDGGYNPVGGRDIPPDEIRTSDLQRLAALKPEEVTTPPPAAIDGVIPHSGPVHPQYASPESRLRTFSEWPPGIKQSPEKLSEAGLYYYGQSDQVKCFYCDGGLREWQENDDPWEEHAGWFSGCAFVRLVKGEAYVERSKRNVRMVVEERRKLMEQEKKNKKTADDSMRGIIRSDSVPMTDEELRRENSRMREERECRVCRDKEVGVVFLPCGHLVTCTSCASTVSECVVCRVRISSSVRVYMA